MPVRVEPMMVTTSTELPGYRVVHNCGIARHYSPLAESPRFDWGRTSDDYRRKYHAADRALRKSYDATEIMQGVSEVLAYGTAVVVERNT